MEVERGCEKLKLILDILRKFGVINWFSCELVSIS